MAITETDITPSLYDFANAKIGQYPYMAKFTGANCPTPATYVPELYNNGLFMVAGGAFAGDTPYFNDLQAGTSIINLGGTVGKVLCVSGMNSKINEKLEDIYSKKSDIQNCTGGLNWFNLNFMSDPNNTPMVGDANVNIRVRIVMNIYQNTLSTTPVFNKIYTVNNLGNILPAADNAATNIAVASTEFGKDTENTVWDPTKWMVYEFDTWVNSSNESPMRIKMEMSNNELMTSTVLIKEVKFLKLTGNTNPIKLRREKSYITLNPDVNTGVDGVLGDESIVAPYTINGQEITVSDNAEIFSVSGMKVANAKAGEAVSLASGFYVARVGNKNIKFIIR